MPENIDNIDGRPAIETDEPMSIQEANVWALEQRSKADARKAAIERLRGAAAKRRERKPVNPLEALKPNPSYKVGKFNAEADAFNVESSDGKKLLGKSLSNGNVKDGQKVRSFFNPNGKAIIDVKPKGRNIVIPATQPKIVEEEEFWPVTSCFLYSKLSETQVDFTDNIATDLTSYDAWNSANILGSPTLERVILFAQRSDTMGDYETADDALTNNLKEDRKLKPGNTGAGGGGAADDAAWGSGSADAVIVWFYIGDLDGAGRGITLAKAGNGQIFKVSGQSIYGENVNTEYGPGLCMEMYRSGFISVGLYPIVDIGQEPLSRHLKNSFPDLGGKIGYWGNIYTWHGEQDYYRGGHFTYLYREYWSGIGGVPAYPTENFETPTSYYSGWEEDIPPGNSPWTLEDAAWYKFGWDYNGNKIGCMSAGAIVAITSAITGSFGCGDTVPNDQWYWSEGIGSSAGALDKRANYSSANGMFVCWQGHRDNIPLAKSFFEAFQAYWKIPGGVKTLRSANPFGCGTGDPGSGGSSYPPPPPGLQRFLVRQYGRKAGIYLKVCEKDYEPIELKLPFEFAALVQKFVLQGAPSVSGYTNNEQIVFTTGGYIFRGGNNFTCAETPHATMSVDGEFIYVDILYGGERVWEDPLSKPIPCRLSNLGAGDFALYSWYRGLGRKENPRINIVGQYTPPGTVEIGPRYRSDHFVYCQSYKIALPTSSTNRTLTIVGSQRYRRGEPIQLTTPSPDNEFNNKFLIFDFRTDKLEDIPPPPSVTGMTIAPWQLPNSEYASFGGLPALTQFSMPGYTIDTLERFNDLEKFYKPPSTWTDMDKIHFELQEAPEAFWPLNTVLPENVFVSPYSRFNIRFTLDGKFGRGSRAEVIDSPSGFGYANSIAPTYSDYSDSGRHLLYTSFKEQLIGNGIKNNEGLVVKWNRVSSSSFPIFGQVKRSY